MMDRTFVTFGNAIARAQVTVTNVAVRIKFLQYDIDFVNLRFLIVVWLPEDQREKLVPERVVVARESGEYD
jgi:hypothetical protein